jgi:hypothetical protein
LHLPQNRQVKAGPVGRKNMNFKIIYYQGDTINISTKVDSGSAMLSDNALEITGKNPISIPFSSIKSVEMFRLHGLGRMIKLVHATGTLFLAVVRINLFGYFVIINFFKAGKLHEQLKEKSAPNQKNAPDQNAVS